jgi:hypothetical protein
MEVEQIMQNEKLVASLVDHTQRLVGISEARALIFGNNISRGAMYQLARTPGFPIVKVGRRKLIPLVQLDAWIAEQSKRTAEDQQEER